MRRQPVATVHRTHSLTTGGFHPSAGKTCLLPVADSSPADGGAQGAKRLSRRLEGFPATHYCCIGRFSNLPAGNGQARRQPSGCLVGPHVHLVAVANWKPQRPQVAANATNMLGGRTEESGRRGSRAEGRLGMEKTTRRLAIRSMAFGRQQGWRGRGRPDGDGSHLGLHGVLDVPKESLQEGGGSGLARGIRHAMRRAHKTHRKCPGADGAHGEV